MVEQSPSQSRRHTSNDVHRMLEILCTSLRKDAARRAFTPRSGQAAPHPLRVLFFELCALSHSLLHANPASTAWLKQWSDLLETVAQFYSEVLGGDPRALAESNSHQNNCVRFSQDIREWIEKVIPHHVNLFRAVYRRPEYVKRREVLRRLLVNLEDFSSLFPDVDNTRRDQLQALMTQIVTGLLGPVDDDEVTLVQDLDPVDFKQLVTGVSGRSFDLFFRNFDWSCFDTDLALLTIGEDDMDAYTSDKSPHATSSIEPSLKRTKDMPLTVYIDRAAQHGDDGYVEGSVKSAAAVECPQRAPHTTLSSSGHLRSSDPKTSSASSSSPGLSCATSEASTKPKTPVPCAVQGLPCRHSTPVIAGAQGVAPPSLPQKSEPKKRGESTNNEKPFAPSSGGCESSGCLLMSSAPAQPDYNKLIGDLVMANAEKVERLTQRFEKRLEEEKQRSKQIFEDERRWYKQRLEDERQRYKQALEDQRYKQALEDQRYKQALEDQRYERALEIARQQYEQALEDNRQQYKQALEDERQRYEQILEDERQWYERVLKDERQRLKETLEELRQYNQRERF